MSLEGGRRSLATVLFALALALGAPPGGASAQARPSPVGASARSLAVPGWGQLALGQRRSWAYAAIEAGAWALWVHRRSRGADLRDRYRSAAWTSGRIPSGARVDGDFAYYEALTKWVRSGAFDRDPGSQGIQPEEDTSTYNGSIWARARDLFIPPGTQPGVNDPRYLQAISYYQDRAYDARFLWDWSGRESALEQYKGLVVDSDGSFREATTALGAVLANHVLSGADAWLSARVRADASARVLPSARGRRWTMLLQIGASR